MQPHSVAPAVLEVGTLFGNRYVIERELGRGGSATVYLAKDTRQGRRVAIKVLYAAIGDVRDVPRFRVEIETVGKFQHPHILPLFESGEVDGTLFYVMPFVEEGSLRTRLDREPHLPRPDIERIVNDVASALDYAHRQNILHRDIKPENILLSMGSAMVADFGIARPITRADGDTTTGGLIVLGTPRYMSPEQCEHSRLDGRSDQYSLACVVYEMLAGTPPFSGPTAQSIILQHMSEHPHALSVHRPGLPAHVEQAVNRALKKVAADRFASVEQFASALRGEAPSSSEPLPARSSVSGPSHPAPFKVLDGGINPTTALQGPLQSAGAVGQSGTAGGRRKLWFAVAAVAIVGAGLAAVWSMKSTDTAPAAGPAAPVSSLAAVPNEPKRGARKSHQPPPTKPVPPISTPRQQGAVNANSRRIAPAEQKPDSQPPNAQSTTATATLKTVSPPPAPAPAPVANLCGDAPLCRTAAGRFTVTISAVTVSRVNYTGSVARNVKLTLTFRNLSNQAISLAYRRWSGQLTDDQGHAYADERSGGDGYVRGIGFSLGQGHTVAAQFVISPNESRDAIFDNVAQISVNEIIGITYTYDLTIDEVDAKVGMGRVIGTYPVQFVDVKERARRSDGSGDDDSWGRAVGGPRVDDEIAGALDQQTAQDQDGCTAEAGCYSSGHLVARVTRVWARRQLFRDGVNRWVKVTMRLRNSGDQPLSLAYHPWSAQLTDDQGHRYANERQLGRSAVSGLEIAARSPLSSPLVLAPGETRDAIFDNFAEISLRDTIGLKYDFDVQLDELELFPSGQTRAVRAHAISLHALREAPPALRTGNDTLRFATGPFLATLVDVSNKETQYSNATARRVTLAIQLRNVSDKPLILGYRTQSQRLTDDAGHVYENDLAIGPRSITGISMSPTREVDPSFIIRPGESHLATFDDVATIPRGDGVRAYSYDLVLDELEVLPSRQVFSTHTYAISFHDFSETPRSKSQMLKDALKSIIKPKR